MITRFIKITNGVTSLGDSVDNDQKMRKVIWALSPTWEVKSTTLKELNDKKEIQFIGLIGNLKTHEIKRKVKEEKTPQKKKILAFRFTSIISDEDEDEQEDDEDLSSQ